MNLVRFALFGILLWLPIPFGSKPEWSVVLFAILICVVAIVWLAGITAGRYGFNQSLYKAWPFHAGFMLLISWLWLQQFPLPLEWVKILSPKAFEYYSQAYSAVGFDLPSRMPLSLDSYATYLSFWLTLGYWLLFSLVLGTINNSKQLVTFAWIIVAAGTFQAAFGAFSLLSGLETLLLAEKESYKGVATGTFVNRNSFAGFLEMTLAVGIGLQMSRMREFSQLRLRERVIQFLSTLLSNKVVLRTCLAIMVIGMVMSRSRMGNSAFFASLILTGLVYVICRRKLTKGVAFLFVSLLVIDVLIVSQWFGLGKVIDRIEQTSLDNESRPNVAQLTINIIEDYPVTGTGTGTYYTALPEYHDGSWRGFYDLAHNDLLQFPAEFGLPAYVVLMIMVLLALWHALQAMRLRKHHLMISAGFSAFMGIIAILIHSTVDFNLQIPANGAYFVVLMALAVHARYLSSERLRYDKRKK